MRLWDFALAAWERPGVAETCLELQDRHGQCVPLLIWLAWAHAEARAPDVETTGRAMRLARDLDAAVVTPLRGAGRALKPAIADLDDDARKRLRAAARALELNAERTLLEALEAVTPAPAGRSEEPLAEALSGLLLAWRGSGAKEASSLAARLAEQLRGPWPC